MVSAQEQAMRRLWKGVCDVVVKEKQKDPDTKQTMNVEKVIAAGVPCRLSFETIAAAGENENAAQLAQSVKLFLGKEVQVPAGSKLVVTQNGVTTSYKQSGPPAIYSCHQELRLELAERWA